MPHLTPTQCIARGYVATYYADVGVTAYTGTEDVPGETVTNYVLIAYVGDQTRPALNVAVLNPDRRARLLDGFLQKMKEAAKS